MALLQLSEPGQSQAPHQHKLAAGIDLGTTNSLVASVRSGKADTLADDQNKSLGCILILNPDSKIKSIPLGCRTSYPSNPSIVTGKNFTDSIALPAFGCLSLAPFKICTGRGKFNL